MSAKIDQSRYSRSMSRDSGLGSSGSDCPTLRPSHIECNERSYFKCNQCPNVSAKPEYSEKDLIEHIRHDHGLCLPVSSTDDNTIFIIRKSILVARVALALKTNADWIDELCLSSPKTECESWICKGCNKKIPRATLTEPKPIVDHLKRYCLEKAITNQQKIDGHSKNSLCEAPCNVVKSRLELLREEIERLSTVKIDKSRFISAEQYLAKTKDWTSGDYACPLLKLYTALVFYTSINRQAVNGLWPPHIRKRTHFLNTFNSRMQSECSAQIPNFVSELFEEAKKRRETSTPSTSSGMPNLVSGGLSRSATPASKASMKLEVKEQPIDNFQAKAKHIDCALSLEKVIDELIMGKPDAVVTVYLVYSFDETSTAFSPNKCELVLIGRTQMQINSSNNAAIVFEIPRRACTLPDAKCSPSKAARIPKEMWLYATVRTAPPKSQETFTSRYSRKSCKRSTRQSRNDELILKHLAGFCKLRLFEQNEENDAAFGPITDTRYFDLIDITGLEETPTNIRFLNNVRSNIALQKKVRTDKRPIIRFNIQRNDLDCETDDGELSGNADDTHSEADDFDPPMLLPTNRAELENEYKVGTFASPSNLFCNDDFTTIRYVLCASSCNIKDAWQKTIGARVRVNPIDPWRLDAVTFEQAILSERRACCFFCNQSYTRLSTFVIHFRLFHPRFETRLRENGPNPTIELAVNWNYDGRDELEREGVYHLSTRRAYAKGRYRKSKTPRKISTPSVGVLLVRRLAHAIRYREVTNVKLATLTSISNENNSLLRITAGPHQPSRTYYDSRTRQPIRMFTSMAQGYDCENEIDPLWMHDLVDQNLKDFTDLNDGERSLMAIWNHHIIKYPVVAAAFGEHICDDFINEHGRTLIQLNLIYNFTLHLCHMVDVHMLSSTGMNNIICKLGQLKNEHFNLSIKNEPIPNRHSLL